MSEDKTLYSAYAGLGRTAMIWGIPLMPGLGVFVAAVMASLLGAAVLGPGGLLCAVPGAPVLIFFKRICETDDQALRILWLEMQCFLARANAGLFGKTYTLAPMKYGRTLRGYLRAFESTASTAMFEHLRERLKLAHPQQETDQ
jgi:type IV secretion system protein VirB3